MNKVQRDPGARSWSATLEVVFWEKRIRDELEALTELRFIDPATGRGYRLELEHVEMRPKGELAPHSGFGVPVTNADPVHVARLKKVELDSGAGSSAVGGTRGGPDAYRLGKTGSTGTNAVEKIVKTMSSTHVEGVALAHGATLEAPTKVTQTRARQGQGGRDGAGRPDEAEGEGRDGR